VTALLLKQQGYDVHGVFIRSWDSHEETGAYSKGPEFSKNCAEREFEMVQGICAQLGIPCTMVDFVREYWNEVFVPFLDEYEQGNTPNPDILCNRFIKFDAFVKYAIDTVEADFVATGHYAKLRRPDDEHGHSCSPQLLQAIDGAKDQTYFLSGVPLNMFDKVLFPLADLEKMAVKQLASDHGLLSASKKESMGICFVGKRPMVEFLKEYLPVQTPGKFEDSDGNVIGEHAGLSFFTIGQKAAIGGQPLKWYVARKDKARNVIEVAPSRDHVSLHTAKIWTRLSSFNWLHLEHALSITKEGATMNFKARTLHRGPLLQCKVTTDATDTTPFQDVMLLVQFTEKEQFGVAVGQQVVLYDGEVCVGGGRIEHTEAPVETREIMS
jgi:tRNA-specific 2-thiouridylase